MQFLSQLVTAGGGQVYDHSFVVPQLHTSLELIHEQAFPCAYALPAPPSGVLEPAQVNVTYAPEGNGTPQTLPKVASTGDCGTGAGWTFDQVPGPTEVIFCDATCAAGGPGPSGQRALWLPDGGKRVMVPWLGREVLSSSTSTASTTSHEFTRPWAT